MKWGLIRQALHDVIVDCTALPDGAVVWKGSLAEQSIVVPTRCVLSTNSILTVGVDETRTDLPAPLADLDVERVGQRAFTFSIQIESQNLADGSTARDLADLIRIRLQRESNILFLDAFNVSLQAFLGTTHRDYLGSGRQVGWAMLDIKMNATDVDLDDTVDAGDWIHEVITTGPVKNDAGTTLGTINEDIVGD